MAASRSDETGKRVERLFSRGAATRPASGWEAEYLARVGEVRAARQLQARGRSPVLVPEPSFAPIDAFARFARSAVVVR